MSPPLRLHNTLARTKEPLQTERPDRVMMYVCGPTAYNCTHIGSVRPAMMFDVLSRRLRHDYPEVFYARNFTDVDDKTSAAAGGEGLHECLLQKQPLGKVDQRNVRFRCNQIANEGVYTLRIIDAGSTESLHARYTFAYKNRDGEWLSAHHHPSLRPAS